jgi:hypothetical protein
MGSKICSFHNLGAIGVTLRIQNAQILSFKQQLRNDEEHLSRLKVNFEEMNRHKLILGQQVIQLSAKVATLIDAKCRELENEVKELKLKPPDSQISVCKPQSIAGPTFKQPDTYVTGTYKPTGATFTMTNFEEYKRD